MKEPNVKLGIEAALLVGGAVLAAGSASVANAGTPDWPNRPVTMVVPTAAGGTLDLVGRILGPRLSELLGKPVVIENVGGTGGVIGASRIAKSVPDGHQILLGTGGTQAQSQSIYRRPPYDALADFSAVTLLVKMPVVLTARKDLPVTNFHEFTAYAKANQGTMQYGSPGAASGPHLACALLNAVIGISVTHLPYRGGAQALQDLIAGRTDYQCMLAGIAIPPIEGKLINPIAVLSEERSAALANVPSAREQGLDDLEAGDWLGLFVPTGTPAEIIHKLHVAASEGLDHPAVSQRLQEIGASIVPRERRGPEYLRDFLPNEIAKWAEVVKKAKVQAD